MLSSIHPLGESGRGNRFIVTAAAFFVGSTLGGATTGAVVGGIGQLLRAVLEPGDATVLRLLAFAFVVLGGFELTGRRLPCLPRQVDENWMNEFRGWVYGLGYGFQLGAGVLTYITTAITWAWLFVLLLSPTWWLSILCGAVFGITRGLSVFATRSVRSTDRLVRFHQRLHASARTVRRVGTVALVGMALTLVVVSTIAPPTE